MSLSEQQIPDFLKERPLWHFYVTGVVVLLLSGWLWWAKFYTAPTHVFRSMLAGSLSTRSFTTETSSTDGQNSLKQLIHTDVQTAQSQSIMELKQSSTHIKKEVVGTRDTDYTRFLAIQSDQKADQKDTGGKPVDTSNILNVWAKSDGTIQSETTANAQQLYAMSTLGVGRPIGSTPVPIGRLQPRERQELLERIQGEHVYQPDYKNVKKERKNGRLLYTYDVKIQAILYIRLMQSFGQQLGLTELDKVDANIYSSAPTLNVKLTVDAVSHRLVRADNGQGYTQNYSGYDIPLAVSLPKGAISTTELQRRLSELPAAQ